MKGPMKKVIEKCGMISVTRRLGYRTCQAIGSDGTGRAPGYCPAPRDRPVVSLSIDLRRFRPDLKVIYRTKDQCWGRRVSRELTLKIYDKKSDAYSLSVGGSNYLSGHHKFVLQIQ